VREYDLSLPEMRVRLLIFFSLLPTFLFSQTSFHAFKKLSCPEKWWVIFHPLVAKKAYVITVEARNISKETEHDSLLDHDADGGQVDAFRHSYWMARLAQEMCARKAMCLGKAHERGNYRDFKKHKTGEEIFSDSIAGVMDLLNNKTGIETGRKNKSIPAEQLQALIKEKILKGEMKIILKDGQGRSLSCDGSIVDLKRYMHVWNVPRCLVDSDKKHWKDKN
jgi:hypothetical protein